MAKLTANGEHTLLPWALRDPETLEILQEGTIYAGTSMQLSVPKESAWLEVRDGPEVARAVVKQDQHIEIDLRDRPEQRLEDVLPGEMADVKRLLAAVDRTVGVSWDPQIKVSPFDVRLGGVLADLRYRFWTFSGGAWTPGDSPRQGGFVEIAGPALPSRCRALPYASAQVNVEADGLLVVRAGNERVDHLLELHRLGAKREASVLFKNELAVELFANKFVDPIGGVAGALFLLRSGQLKGRDSWWGNLGRALDVPDGGAVYAQWLLRTGGAPSDIEDACMRSVDLGLPVFREALRLLYNGLGLFSSAKARSARRMLEGALMEDGGGSPWSGFAGTPLAPGRGAEPDFTGPGWKPAPAPSGPLRSHINIPLAGGL